MTTRRHYPPYGIEGGTAAEGRHYGQNRSRRGRVLVLPEPEDSAYGFGIADTAIERHLSGLRQGKEAGGDLLISFGLSLASAQAAGKINGHGFVEETRADVEMEDFFPVASGKAGLFEQLAAGGGERRFAFVNTSGGQFPHHGLGGMAILTLEKDAGLGAGVVDGQNHDGSRVADYIAAGANPAGLFDHVGSDVENRT